MKKIKVALVDDHELIRKSISRLLDDDDLAVVFDAGNGLEMIPQFKKNPVDVVLMDISMPEMDGVAATQWLKENAPDTKVIALSVMNDDISVIRMLKAGARAYLLKSSNPKELVEAIRDVHTKGYHFSDLVSGTLISRINSDDGAIANPDYFTDKEMEFLKLCCSELTYKEIGSIMKVSPRTAEGYAKQLCERLKIKTRVGLVLFALRRRIVDYSSEGI